MIIWNFLNTYHLQKYYFTVTSENGKNNLNALFKKALAIESHHPEEAIKYYNSIIDDSESFKNIQKITISAYHNKGVLLEKLGKHEESIELLNKAKNIQIQRNEREAKKIEDEHDRMYDKAFQFLMEGKYAESIESFDELLFFKPNDATALSNLGIAYLAIAESDDYDLAYKDRGPDDDSVYDVEYLCQNAIDCFDKSLRIEPKNDVVLYNKARILVLQSAAIESTYEDVEVEDDDECMDEKQVLNNQALMCLDKALKINPNSARTNFAKALVLIDLDRIKDSVEFMDKALEIEPENERFLDFKGGTVAQLGMLEESVECFEKLIQIDPNNLKAWYNKGVSLLSQVNPYPNNPTLEDKSKLDDSIKCMERVIEIDPNYAAAWYNKGTSCIVSGRSEESRICLDKALEIDPDFLGKVKQSTV